jgi:dTDP-4-dehydrorhamnose reductase
VDAKPTTRSLLISPDGMLGRAWEALLRERGMAFDAISYPQLDLRDAASVAQALRAEHRLVINCAAYTDVDGAEKNEVEASAVNAGGVELLARRCRELGACLLHYSTDYVFDGRASAPYPVEAPRAPQNAYGRGKARGEELLVASGAEHLIVRTSWLYAPWGKNFVDTIARAARERPVLRVVNDQRGRPTSAQYLALRTLGLLEHGARGIAHVTDGGECTWYEFAREIVRLEGAPARVEPCTTEEFPRPALRPAYSVLALDTTEALLGPSRTWQDNLADVLNARRG